MNNNNYNDNNLSNISQINVSWTILNKKGLTNINLNNKAAIYIYQHKNKSQIYVGSASKLSRRIGQHRSCVKNGRKSCPKFYNSIRKHGWDNFRLGIIYIDISGVNTRDKHGIRKFILKREQYYLDILKPNLNIRRAVGSTLGYKHSKKMLKKNMGL